jgi:hypothetical protein
MVVAEQRIYDAWKGHADNSANLEDAGKNISHEDPVKRGNARSKLESTLRNYDGNLVFGRHDVDSHLMTYFNDAQKELVGRSIDAFAENPDGIVEYAYAADPKKFADNYLSIDPSIVKVVKVDGKDVVQIEVLVLGNENRDKALASAHNIYHTLNQYLEKRKEAKDLKDLSSFTKESAKTLEASIALHFQLMGADEKTAMKRAKLIKNTYESSTPEEAYQMLQYTANQMKDDIERIIPEDKRAEYALKLLKAKIATNLEPNIKTASQDLYSIVK